MNERCGMTIDYDLERNGFIKVRDTNIRYSSFYNDKPIYLTEKQKRTLIAYMGYVENKRNIKCTFNDNIVSLHDFMNMDNIAILNKFME